jgi:type VI secretion system secreted protein VgrG
VGQIWAGKRWGASFWPRIGQEVIVAFQEGDPDQPIIIGSVYNAEQMPPYLGNGPDSKHPNDNKLSGIKTNSTKGGEGFNEIRFDDTKDKEQVFIHAERNMDVRIGASQRTSMGGDCHSTVGGTSNEDVGKDFYLKAGMKMVIEAGIELTIKSLGGFIKIDSTGITIQGTMVRINSGGAPGIIPEPPAGADDAKSGSKSAPNR